MKPGDLLLYESARLLHGRPSPFKGRSYANVFVHYQPQDGWEVDF
jgi:prolyl 4-hydroxylase